MLLHKIKQLNLTLIPPDTPMATTSTIKRPYITPAIEECFDCESDCWLMAASPITGSGTDSEQNTENGGDWDEDFSKQNNNSNFNIWDDDAEEY